MSASGGPGKPLLQALIKGAGRVLLALTLLFVVACVVGYAPRKVAVPLAWVLLPASAYWVLSGRWRLPLALFVVFLAVSFCPIDLWIKTGGTHLKVVRVVEIPITEAQNKLIEDGELLCFEPECVPSTRRCNRPKWVLLWMPSSNKGSM